ncbi:protein phosphatase 2C domain-containing protein [Nocardioides sp. WL0053]|uniref:Protein phosphatase 2C domain-containing protein n=1 Tax=Nocardioides jiangsuensis TaxID=2866161 RepID=A0ABS7RKY5_9ACTN|nr:protein phosphatase 2C domain-containing protein [Nocardioides jiangsuensis]MBY9074212.1 protein phosphatase 2C domain-containing protein [Nocardioides jiangsuensis]
MTSPSLRLRYAALSDVGRVRKDNQDSGYAGEHLLVIADGVGGAARGDIASSTAVQILRRLDDTPSDDLLEALAGAIHRAHDRIAELVEEDPELEGTSTTVTVALFDGNRIGVGHVGDSRGYLLRDGELSQLTKDHTFVQSLIDEGRITEEEARTHPHRNLILRAVDGVHETDPDLFLLELAPGDRILLCSDGASGVLDNARLADILGTGTVDYAVVELVRASLDAGSTDNITCVVADVVDAAAAAADAETAAAATTGPMLVGAAADQPRRAGASSKSFFRGHRSGDTGEMEPVPGTGEPVDPEELRYAPRAPRRFTWLRWVVGLLVLLGLLSFGSMAAYGWTQKQYYVAVSDSKVAIFRGIQADLPGLTLSRLHSTSRVTLESLPEYRAEQVRDGISADDLDDARRIVANINELARVCPTPSPSPSPSPSAEPTGKGDREPTRRPSGGASDEPTASPTDRSTAGASQAPEPSPSASPSPTLAPPDCVEATP